LLNPSVVAEIIDTVGGVAEKKGNGKIGFSISSD
jgi:hypothetical protein